MGEVLVGFDDGGGVEFFWFEAGSDHIDAIECCFGGDFGCVAVISKGVLGDCGDEVFADLVFVDDFPDRDTDPVGPAKSTRRHRRGDLVQLLLGGVQ